MPFLAGINIFLPQKKPQKWDYIYLKFGFIGILWEQSISSPNTKNYLFSNVFMTTIFIIK